MSDPTPAPDRSSDPTLPPLTDDALTARVSLAWAKTLELHPTAAPDASLRPAPSAAFAPTVPPPAAPATAGDSLAPRAVLAFPGVAPDGAPDDTPDYAIIRELGAGGMGVVYEAEQATIRRPVALKLLRTDTPDQAAERRFVEEARNTGRLEHPNIVPVYDLGRTRAGRLFLGMKLVRGRVFRTLLREAPAVDAATRRRHLEVVVALCDAVAFAHSRRVLHRDLKPENVMVGEFGEVQLMDWGLATELDAGGRVKTDEGAAGTPCYLSPEQAAGEGGVGTWSDVYLLGATLYEVLCGRAPHAGAGSVLHTLFRALKGEVEPPSRVAPERHVPRDLEALCLAALDPDPTRRPPGAKALQEGLRRHLAHADALGLVDRARALVESGQAADEELARSQLLLEQALALWPESAEARALSTRVRLLEVEQALDRGDARRATTAVARLEPGAELAPERLEVLRAAVGRLVRRTRTQLLSGLLVIALWFGGNALLEALRAPATAGRMYEQGLSVWTGEAWRGAETGLPTLTARLTELREHVRSEAPGPFDDDALSAAGAWLALRAGEPRRALDLLPVHRRGDPFAVLDAVPGGEDPLASARAWREVAALQALVAPIVLDAGEAALLVARARVLPPAALARQAPALRARLDALGALGLLADAASAAPAPLVAGLPLRLAVREERERQPARWIAALDPEDGRERWRWPPPLVGKLVGRLLPPLLVREGAAWTVLVAWGTDLVGLDPETGRVRTRLRLRAPVVGLLPGGPGEVLAVVPSESGRSRSLLVRCSPRARLGPLAPSTTVDYRIPERLAAAQVVAADDTRPATDPHRAREEAARLAAARALDPAGPFWDGLEAERLAAAGDQAGARAAAARARDADLGAWELVLLARRLEEHGLHAEVDGLLERAAEVDARDGLNPDLRVNLLGNPAAIARELAGRALAAGDEERGLRRMALSRELATVLDGDLAGLEVEARWLEARGRAAELEHLRRELLPRARALGDAYHFRGAVVAGFDLAVAVALVLSFAAAFGAVALVARTHPARARDLHELGFRSATARLVALVVYPGLRLRYTTVAYATRVERLLFVLACVGALTAFAYVDVLVSRGALTAMLPPALGLGSPGDPTVQEHLQLRADEGRASPALARVRAEGALQRGGDEAAGLLREVLALAPDDPFAHANLAWLAERRGDLAGARAGWSRAATAPGEPGAPARWNLARLDGTLVAGERPGEPLPPPYRAARRLDPEGRRPLRQLASAADLEELLRAAYSVWGQTLRRLALGQEGTGLASMAIGSGAEEAWKELVVGVERWARYLLPILLLFTLVHLPFGTRAAAPGPATPLGRWAARLAAGLDLLLPGARWLAERRAARGLALMTLVAMCATLAWLRVQGPTLTAHLLESPTPFGPLAPPDLLSSPWLRAATGPATVALALSYAATWLAAALRLRGR